MAWRLLIWWKPQRIHLILFSWVRIIEKFRYRTELHVANPVTDLSMPVCDGFESAKRIRKHEKLRNKRQDVTSSPAPAFIIAVTGQASDQDEELAIGSGMDH